MDEEKGKLRDLIGTLEDAQTAATIGQIGSVYVYRSRSGQWLFESREEALPGSYHPSCQALIVVYADGSVRTESVIR